MLLQLLMGSERTVSVTVHEKPDARGDRIERAEKLRFIKDGFNWGAFLLPPAFFAQQGVWLGVLVYGLGLATLAVVTTLLGLPPLVLMLLVLLAHVLIGSEADELTRAQLATRGWAMIGQVTGTGMIDCERRFLEGWLPSVPMRVDVTNRAATGGPGQSSDGAAVAAFGVGAGEVRSAPVRAPGAVIETPKRNLFSRLLLPRSRT